MANDIHTPDKSENYSIRDEAPADRKADSQPWNRSRMVVEPVPSEPQGQFSDRIRVSPIDAQGRAKNRALKGWPTGTKRA